MGFPAPDNCFNCRMQNNKPGNFAVFIDDMKRPVLQTAISLRKSSVANADFCYDDDRDRCVLDEIGNAYIGFTAATGGELAQGPLHGRATQLLGVMPTMDRAHGTTPHTIQVPTWVQQQ